MITKFSYKPCTFWRVSGPDVVLGIYTESQTQRCERNVMIGTQSSEEDSSARSCALTSAYFKYGKKALL